MLYFPKYATFSKFPIWEVYFAKNTPRTLVRRRQPMVPFRLDIATEIRRKLYAPSITTLSPSPSGVTRLFHLWGGGWGGGKGLSWGGGGQAVVTLSKRSATIGWRVAYNNIFAKYTS